MHALAELKRGVTWAEEDVPADGSGGARAPRSRGTNAHALGTSVLGSGVDGGATPRGSSIKQNAPVLRRAPADVRVYEVQQQSNQQHDAESSSILRLRHRSVMEQVRVRLG